MYEKNYLKAHKINFKEIKNSYGFEKLRDENEIKMKQ